MTLRHTWLTKVGVRVARVSTVKRDGIALLMDAILDKELGRDPSKPYETMVFAENGDPHSAGDELDNVRYATEEEAIADHDRLVAKWCQETGAVPEKDEKAWVGKLPH